MLPKIAVMELRLIRDAFDDPGYVFELKHDGFCGLAYIESAALSFRGVNVR